MAASRIRAIRHGNLSCPNAAVPVFEGDALDADQRIEKVERRMLGRAGVVKLWPPDRQLVIGEGLETTLAAATRIPFEGKLLTPAWAALSSQKLRFLPTVPGVERLIVLVDHDDKGVFAAAAHARFAGPAPAARSSNSNPSRRALTSTT